MRRVTAVRDVPVAPQVAFDRLAAFESAAHWDPGVSAARRLTPGPVGRGTQFEVTAAFLGQSVPMDYELVVHEPPHHLGFVGRAARSHARDDITLTPIPGGTRITWTLELRMLGLARLSEPLLGPVLRRLADHALDGLQADLSSSR